MTDSYLGLRLSKVMLQLGISEAAMAEEMGVTQKAVNNWKRGINVPRTEDRLQKLADFCGCTVDELLGEPMEGAVQASAKRRKTSPKTKAEEPPKKTRRALPFVSVNIPVTVGDYFCEMCGDVVHADMDTHIYSVHAGEKVRILCENCASNFNTIKTPYISYHAQKHIELMEA